MNETFAVPVSRPIAFVPPGPFLASIQRQIEDAIAINVPADRRGVVLMIADSTGVRFGVAGRLGAGWLLSGAAVRAWDGDVSGNVRIVFS